VPILQRNLLTSSTVFTLKIEAAGSCRSVLLPGYSITNQKALNSMVSHPRRQYTSRSLLLEPPDLTVIFRSGIIDVLNLQKL